MSYKHKQLVATPLGLYHCAEKNMYIDYLILQAIA